MTDHYNVLKLDRGASQSEVQSAFDELLAARRARRQKTSDLHAAMAVLGDPAVRRGYDLSLLREAAGERIVHAGAVTIEFAKDAVPDIDVREVLAQTKEVALKMTVLGSGAIAKAAEFTASASRAVQVAASRQLQEKS